MFSRGSQNVICGLKWRLKMSLSSSDDGSRCAARVAQVIADGTQHSSLHRTIPACRGVERKSNATTAPEPCFWKDRSAYEAENCQVEVPVTARPCLLKAAQIFLEFIRLRSILTERTQVRSFVTQLAALWPNNTSATFLAPRSGRTRWPTIVSSSFVFPGDKSG